MEHAACLYDLTKQSNKFIWTETREEALNNINKHSKTSKYSPFPQKSGRLVLKCDASRKAIRAALYQKIDDIDQPLAFASPHRNRKKIVLLSDHNQLTHIHAFKDTYNLRARMISHLSDFDFKIKHIRGRDNVVTDGLSRSLGSIAISNNFDARTIQKHDYDIAQISFFLKDGLTKHQEFGKLDDNEYWHIHDHLRIIDDELFYLNTKTNNLTIVVPKMFRREIKSSYHKTDAIHFGTNKTTNLISRRFYFPSIQNYVYDHIKEFSVCLRSKDAKPKPKTPLFLFQPTQPLEFWHYDFFGPLLTTSNGNRFILLMIDRFSKYTEALPVANISAKTTAQCIVDNIIMRFGVPSQIHTDQGRQFESDLLQSMCSYLGVKKSRTTA
ncbi:Transposon Tf2-6 polyprotein [Thelohanellus kitauei]|uniref:Transposon Tf2-6 polyprotein n=1 Tax=Thelohanellus kitauei TaxID=669202 RepID=A0A0C2N4T3_THEKT|nr:Transposon Tf2-6 polyprotein [Thelohanellus kitauei]